jgi:DNA-binding XRE family transcriptional regulator
MMNKRNTRVFKKADPELRQHITDLQEALDQELPAIKLRARMVKQEWLAARNAILKLREERERLGLSLSQVRQRSSIGREALCKLENDLEPNPTIKTLARYADALGLEIDISFRPKPQEASSRR